MEKSQEASSRSKTKILLGGLWFSTLAKAEPLFLAVGNDSGPGSSLSLWLYFQHSQLCSVWLSRPSSFLQRKPPKSSDHTLCLSSHTGC